MQWRRQLTTGDSLMASSLAVLTQPHPTQGSTEEAVLYSNKFSTNGYSGYPVTTTSLNLSWKLLTNPSLEKPMHRLRPSARLSNLPGNPLISLNFTSLQLLLANALLWIPSLCYLMNDFFSRSWNISQEEATKNSLSWRTFVLLDLSRDLEQTAMLAGYQNASTSSNSPCCNIRLAPSASGLRRRSTPCIIHPLCLHKILV